MKKLLLLICYCYATLIIAQPSNDDCANAVVLGSLTNYCSAPGQYTNVAATASGYAAATCWGSTNNEVWFQFTAIASDVLININGNVGGNGTLNRPQVALYSGTCGGTINQLACASAAVGVNTLSLYKGALTPGVTYYIRVDGFNNNVGTFQICINNYIPIATSGADCNTASFVCSQNTINNVGAVGAGLNANEGIGSCTDYGVYPIEANTAWYTWTCGTSGTLTFNIVPNAPNDDFDFVLFRLNGGSCNNKTILRCNASSCIGATGLNMTDPDISEPPGCLFPQNNYCSFINMVAGETYGLLVENWTSAGQGFTLNFGGTATFAGPLPSFAAAPNTVCAGNTVTFTSTSTNCASYNWNFGAGATPATANTPGPHTVSYATSGIKTISLTGTSVGGCQIIYSQSVTINPIPTVTATPTTQTICSGGSISIALTSNSVGTTFNWTASSTVGITGAIAGSGTTISQSLSNTNASAGTVTYTIIPTNNGCVGTPATMVITVNPSPTVTVNSPTICPTQTATLTATGASSYTWSIGATLISTNSATASPVSTTSYTVTGSNAGCISIAVSTVTVSNNLSVTVNSPTICSGQTATLTASGATSYLWSVGANSTGVATAAVNPIVTSTYTVTGTSGGCTGTAVATITVNSALNVTVNDATICAGQTAILTANGANNYTWSAGANTTGVNTANASPAATTTYTVTGISGSCTNTAMATVNVNLPFAITINNPTICAGLQATLTANGATSYSWSSGLTATSNNTATVSPASTTTYTVIGTLSGCTNSATATVTVNALPTITSIANIVQCANTSITFPIFTSNLAATNFSWTNSNNAIGLASIGNGNIPTFNGINSSTNPINSVITVSPTGPAPSNCAGTPTTFTITINPSPIVTVNNTSICNGQTATLTANGANSYVWSNGATATTALANIVQTSPSLTTSYTVTGTSYGCSNSAVANVVVNNGPAITINSPTICNGQSATLTAIGSAAYTWSVGAIPAGTNTAIVSPITTSTFTVIGNSFGCVSTATTVVVVNPVPITNFTIPSQANINSNVSFVNTSLNGINYSWDFGDNTTSNETNPTHSYNSYGIFCTILTANNVGCTDTTMHCIEIASQFEFYLPSAFTPNGDGNNDYFAGIGFGFTDYEMSIYDRWGIKIFETNDIKNKWDGKVHYTGEIAKQDIYLYVVKLKDDNKIEKRYTGAVTLVK